MSRLVALNHARAEEEKRGLIRWLRPDYQAPASTPKPEQKQIDLGEDSSSSLNDPFAIANHHPKSKTHLIAKGKTEN